MVPEPVDPHDAERWRRVAPVAGVTTAPCPDSLILAAYLDDRVSETERSSVEGHLAWCDRCVEVVAGVRLDARNEGANAASPQPVGGVVIDRALGLVPEADAPVVLSFPGRPRRAAGSLARWGLAAAACLGVCVAGYQVGARTSGGPQIQSSEQDLAGAMLEIARHPDEAPGDMLFNLVLISDESDETESETEHDAGGRQ